MQKRSVHRAERTQTEGDVADTDGVNAPDGDVATGAEGDAEPLLADVLAAVSDGTPMQGEALVERLDVKVTKTGQTYIPQRRSRLRSSQYRWDSSAAARAWRYSGSTSSRGGEVVQRDAQLIVGEVERVADEVRRPVVVEVVEEVVERDARAGDGEAQVGSALDGWGRGICSCHVCAPHMGIIRDQHGGVRGAALCLLQLKCITTVCVALRTAEGERKYAQDNDRCVSGRKENSTHEA